MVVDPACFNNYFEADEIHTVATYVQKRCNAFGYSMSNCPKVLVVSNTAKFEINADILFLYNYTCSSSIIRAYVPLYENMYCFVHSSARSKFSIFFDAIISEFLSYRL